MGYGSLDTAILSIRGTRQDLRQDAEKIAWTEKERVEMQNEIVLFPEPLPRGETSLSQHHPPIPLTPLVGREQEVTALCALLQRPEVRLVTLAGTGGVGKTRLALEIGTEVRDSFADGVYFVSLAPVRDPSLIISTITQTLALKELPNQSLLELLKAFLRYKSLLLLLDNFEQIIGAAPLLNDLLETCPSLKILVTSRSVLHLRGEYEFLVPPLALPDLTVLPTSEVLAQYSAVALFLQRVHTILPAFQMLPCNARSIAEVCVHLDGLPLALELAATRMKLFTPQALLVRLGHLLPLLTSGARDAPERQQTLRQTIAWSYHLLTAAEQRLFQWLSVFVRGCTLEAIEALYETAEEPGGQLVETVTSLLDQSLLQVQRQEGTEPRFLMLETIREYALECLEGSGEAETMCQRHATYYLTLAEEAEPHLSSVEQATWLRRLEDEHDNICAALHWFLAAQKREEALRVSGALWIFWAMSHLSEGQRWFEQVLAVSSDTFSEREARARIKALHGAGVMAYYEGNYARVAELCEATLKIARAVGDKSAIALVLNGLGELALATEDHTKLHAVSQESVPLLREIGDPWRLAEGLFLSAYGFYFQGDLLQAHALAEESLTLCREVGEPFSTVRVLDALGYFAYTQGDLVTAYQRYKEGLLIAKAVGRKPFMASCLIALGVVAMAQDQQVWAAQLWGAADEIAPSTDPSAAHWYTQMMRTRLGYDRLVARVHTQLGKEAFAVAWNEGQAMTQEQLLEAPALISSSRQPSTEPSQAPPVQHAASLVKLTQREREVLHLLAQGLTSAQIAEQLVIGLVTVNSHVRSIYSKLGVSSRSAATRYAMEHHLL